MVDTYTYIILTSKSWQTKNKSRSRKAVHIYQYICMYYTRMFMEMFSSRGAYVAQQYFEDLLTVEDKRKIHIDTMA